MCNNITIDFSGPCVYRSSRGTKHFGYKSMSKSQTDKRSSGTTNHGAILDDGSLKSRRSHKKKQASPKKATSAGLKEGLLIDLNEDTKKSSATGVERKNKNNSSSALAILEGSIAGKYGFLPPPMGERSTLPYDPFIVSNEIKNLNPQVVIAGSEYSNCADDSQNRYSSTSGMSTCSFDSFSSFDSDFSPPSPSVNPVVMTTSLQTPDSSSSLCKLPNGLKSGRNDQMQRSDSALYTNFHEFSTSDGTGTGSVDAKQWLYVNAMNTASSKSPDAPAEQYYSLPPVEDSPKKHSSGKTQKQESVNNEQTLQKIKISKTDSSNMNTAETKGADKSFEWLNSALLDFAIGPKVEPGCTSKSNVEDNTLKRNDVAGDSVRSSLPNATSTNNKIPAQYDEVYVESPNEVDDMAPPVPVRDYPARNNSIPSKTRVSSAGDAQLKTCGVTASSKSVVRGKPTNKKTAEVRPFPHEGRPKSESSGAYHNTSQFASSTRNSEIMTNAQHASHKTSSLSSHSSSVDVSSSSNLCDFFPEMQLAPQSSSTSATPNKTRTSLSKTKPNSQFYDVETETLDKEAKKCVREVQRQISGASKENSRAALVASRWNVEAAVQSLKIDHLFRVGVASRERCQNLLEKHKWDMELAGSDLLDEVSTGSAV